MNILYFSPIPFEPVRHGNISTVNQYVNYLSQKGHNIHFVFLDEMGYPVEYIETMKKKVKTFDIVTHNSIKTEKNPENYDIFDSRYVQGLGELVSELCEKYDIEALICTYIFHSKLLEFVPTNIIKIIDTHDKMTNRHLLLRENNIKDEMFSCTEYDEAKYLNRADIIWARRDEERDYFNKITHSNKAVTVPHFEPEKFLNKNYIQLKRIGILASNNEVNYTTVCNFVRCFNKFMKKEKLDMELVITGQVKSMIYPRYKPFRNLSNLYYKLTNKNYKIKGENIHLFKKKYINLTGPIDNIKEFYENIDLVVVPITFGTGINVKMVEAMAYGVPVISTECGIKGLKSDSEYHHCCDIEDLLAKILEIYKNPKLLSILEKESKKYYLEFNKNAKLNIDKFLTNK